MYKVVGGRVGLALALLDLGFSLSSSSTYTLVALIIFCLNCLVSLVAEQEAQSGTQFLPNRIEALGQTECIIAKDHRINGDFRAVPQRYGESFSIEL